VASVGQCTGATTITCYIYIYSGPHPLVFAQTRVHDCRPKARLAYVVCISNLSSLRNDGDRVYFLFHQSTTTTTTTTTTKNNKNPPPHIYKSARKVCGLIDGLLKIGSRASVCTSRKELAANEIRYAYRSQIELFLYVPIYIYIYIYDTLVIHKLASLGFKR